MSYLDKNLRYWSKGYSAPHVESFIYRFHGRYLKPRSGLDLEGARLVDFGCGQGANANFFHMQGLRVRGCDISEHDIGVARARYPHIAEAFQTVSPAVGENEYYGYPDDVTVVLAIQSLYYLSDTDMTAAIDKLHGAMKPGGIFFATMMSAKNSYFEERAEQIGSGLQAVSFSNDRIDAGDHYINFTMDEDHLVARFDKFERVFVGWYDQVLSSEDGSCHHYVFCGRKA